tara:strand:+ start:35 stop:277 length:243 start_codon:yes stop_codon:yes gene_type:complete
MAEVNKNPYEIRLETLKMAKEMLDKQYDMAIETTKNSMEMWKEAGKTQEQFLAEYIPKMYQPQEVVKTANEFYSFITEKK